MMEVVEVESSSSLEIIPVLSSQCRTVEVQSAGSSPGSIPGTGDMRRDLEVSTSDTGMESSNVLNEFGSQEIDGKMKLVEGIQRCLILYQNLVVEKDRITAIVEDAVLSTDGDYSAEDAAIWGEDFSIPEEAVLEGERLLSVAGGNLEEVVRTVHADTAKDRLNRDRIERWTSDDNPDRGLLFELVGGIKVETPPDFTPNGTSALPPLRELYKKVHGAVDKMIYDSHKKGWCFFLTMASALLITGIHFVSAHWAVNKGKVEGRTIADSSGGRPGSILNGPEVRDLLKAHYHPINHPTIVILILLLLAFKAKHPDRSWDDIDLWKADVSSAFNRLYWEPSAVKLFAMELIGGICVLYFVATFGYTGTPFAFEVCTRAFRWEFKKLLKSFNDMYVDDVMAGGFREDLPGDKAVVKERMDGLLGPGAFSEKKYECTTNSIRRIDWLGFTVCLRGLVLTISRRNFRRTVLGFLTVDLDRPVPYHTLERLASWASRYSIICTAMRPFSYRLYASFSWMENKNASIVLSPDIIAIVWLWRASLCALALDEEKYARSIFSFQPKEPKVLARFDSSLKGIGFLLGWLTSHGPVWFAGGSFSVRQFDFGTLSKFQNCSEFIGINCITLALISLGLTEVGVLLEGDSSVALSWAMSEHYSGNLVFNASLVHTALASIHKPSYANKNHIKAEQNTLCDGLSRGKTLEDIGLGHIHHIIFAEGSPHSDILLCCNPNLVVDDILSEEETFSTLWKRIYTLANDITHFDNPIFTAT